MIRPVTLVTAMMMLGSGAWMFVVKHRAEQLDQKIGGVTAQIRSSEQRIRVLRAEWALETDPNRLSRLAAMFLPQLKPMKPDQLVTWNQLAGQLPAPGATVPRLPLPPPLPDELPDLSEATAPAGPVASIAKPAAAPTQAVKPVPPRGQAPVQLAATQADTYKAHHQTPHRPVPRRVAQGHHKKTAHPQVREATRSPQELGTSVLAQRSVVHPMGARVMTITASAPDMQPPAPPAPIVAAPRPAPRHRSSVFGNYGANLPPPQPVDGSSP